MIEVVKHLFGVCGEGHLTIWHIMGYILTPIVFFYNTIKIYFVSVLKKIKKNSYYV